MVRALLVSTVVLLTTFPLLADDPVFSGPQPGEKLTPFKVQGVLGPQAGQEIELIGQIKGGPCMIIFVHEWTRPLLQLIRPLDNFADKWSKDGLATQIVMLSSDRPKAEQFLQTARGSLNLKAPAGISVDGQEGPGNYGLNRKMTVTILVARENKVVANFAIVQPNETDAPKVLEAVAKVLGKPIPTADEIQAAGSPRRPDVAPKRPDPKTNQGAPDPELAGLMRRMINLNNDEAAVKEVSDAMVKWAGTDRARRAQLTQYCQMILKLGYGNDIAKRALRRLAGE